MLVRRALAMVSFAGVASWSGLAGAQYFHADPAAKATAGYNFNEVISDTPSIEPRIQSGPIVTLAPSLALTYETPRVTQTLTLIASFALPLTKGDNHENQPPSYSFKANYLSNIPLDALTRLTITGGATAAPVNGFATLQDASLTPIDAPPGDPAYNLSVTGSESLRRDITEDIDVTQSTNVFYNYPFNSNPVRPSTLTEKSSLAGTRRWPLDTLTLTLASAVTHYGPGETSQGVSEPRTQVMNDLTLMWRRPLTDSLTSSLRAGLNQTISQRTSQGQVWAPTGGATLVYTLEPAVITLSYSYSSMVDIYTATTNLTNQVTLRGVVPLWPTGLLLTGSTGFIHATPIGDVGVGRESFTSDISLAYEPIYIPKLSFSVRGLYTRQMPLAEIPGATTRYGFIANIGFSYPNVRATDTVARITPTYTPTSSGANAELLAPESSPAELQAPLEGAFEPEPSEPAPEVRPPAAAPPATAP